MTSLDQLGLVDRIAETLRDRILRGEIAIGGRLPQTAVAAGFGVSRTPVREALRKLEADGMVEIVPNRGAIVRGPTTREIREAYVVRAELEGVAAELATPRIAESSLRILRRSVTQFRETLDAVLTRRREGGDGAGEAELAAWDEANDAFHRAIHDASGNRRLVAVLQELDLTFPRGLTAVALGEGPALIEQNVEEHVAILAAIERNDPRAARDRMRAHVRRSGELVADWFERRTPAGPPSG